MMAGQRLTDLLALSHVPRWSIVNHSKPQSVADHTFRVMVIALEIAERLDITLNCSTLKEILFHDAPESRTADIPNPAKSFLLEHSNLEYNPRAIDVHFCPWLRTENINGIANDQSIVMHLADKIEGYTFILRHGIGPHATAVATGCMTEIDKMLRALPDQTFREPVLAVISEIILDHGRVNW